ncbi:MAG TPA: GDP-mannose 4,6-dehydratase [Ignavibacteria bacterium]
MSKKILVTGAGGFIGSHLVELLLNCNFEIKAFIHYNSRNNWGWLESSNIKNNIEITVGDIRDYDSVYRSLKGCYSIFHLAALIGIPYSYISPKAYIETNINGTYNVLQASKELDLEQVIITSTSETYGTAQYVPIDEKHPLVGQSPYSATKIASDQLAISYFRSFNTPVKIIRPFNTYGPRQSARAIIPTIISQLLFDKDTLFIGNTTPTRDFTYVKDTCKGFLEIFKSNDLFGEVTNIGMNHEISIKELIELIANIMGKSIKIIEQEERIRPKHSEVERLLCNNTKIITKTKWKPDYNLISGIEETINWMRNNIHFYKPTFYNY